MNFKFFIFVLLLLISGSIFSQSNDKAFNESTNLLSRYRFSGGYVNLLLEDAGFEFRHPFFNLSFRSSGFEKASPSFQIKLSFEPGINGLIVNKKILDDGTDLNIFFVPYAKFGPEMKLGRNVLLGGSLGLILITYEKFFPFPFLGLNSFYLIPMNEKLNIEIESGFHTTFSPENLPLLFYITAGVSFN
jgi:hypothetical protein